MDAIENEKRIAAEAAVPLVEDGMSVGLGTGSTVAYLLPALAARRLRLRCVATSRVTEEVALELGLSVEPFSALERLDIAIDGADQITPEGWLIKGGGGAHTREKIVAAASDRFVVIASSDKLVEVLRPPVPLEVMAFGVRSTLREAAPAELRAGTEASPDGGVIADYVGPVDAPAALAARLSAIPGIVDHGLFEPALVSEALIASGDSVEHLLFPPVR